MGSNYLGWSMSEGLLMAITVNLVSELTLYTTFHLNPNSFNLVVISLLA